MTPQKIRVIFIQIADKFSNKNIKTSRKTLVDTRCSFPLN